MVIQKWCTVISDWKLYIYIIYNVSYHWDKLKNFNISQTTVSIEYANAP